MIINFQSGFTGPTCSQRFDVCQSNPCLNGVCVSPLPGIFRCTCQPGYMGNYCEITQFVCDYTTCLNGGKFELIFYQLFIVTDHLCH